MKTLVLLLTTLVALTLPISAQASESNSSKESYCESLRSFSETVMRVRQNGGSIRDMLDITDKSDAPVLRQIVIQAYRNPQMTTPSNQDRFVREFSTAIYLHCLGVK